MVLSPEPVTMPAANLTVDDEPTFWAITSRGPLRRDDGGANISVRINLPAL
jgi:hypothetical protein